MGPVPRADGASPRQSEGKVRRLGFTFTVVPAWVPCPGPGASVSCSLKLNTVAFRTLVLRSLCLVPSSFVHTCFPTSLRVSTVDARAREGAAGDSLHHPRYTAISVVTGTGSFQYSLKVALFLSPPLEGLICCCCLFCFVFGFFCDPADLNLLDSKEPLTAPRPRFNQPNPLPDGSYTKVPLQTSQGPFEMQISRLHTQLWVPRGWHSPGLCQWSPVPLRGSRFCGTSKARGPGLGWVCASEWLCDLGTITQTT